MAYRVRFGNVVAAVDLVRPVGAHDVSRDDERYAETPGPISSRTIVGLIRADRKALCNAPRER